VGFALTPAEAGAYYTTAKALSRYPCYSLYRIDLLVEGKVIVELKAVDRIEEIHKAQVLSYLKLSGCKVGLLINFNVEVLVQGVHRLVNGLEE
jgi:GxxExxY protein